MKIVLGMLIGFVIMSEVSHRWPNWAGKPAQWVAEGFSWLYQWAKSKLSKAPQ